MKSALRSDREVVAPIRTDEWATAHDFAHPSVEPRRLSATAVAVRPVWIWLVATLTAIAVHVGVFAAVSSFHEAPPPALDEVQLTLVARGDPIPEETVEQAPQVVPDPSALVPAVETLPQLPEVIAPPPPEIAPPPPVPEPVTEIPPPTPAPVAAPPPDVIPPTSVPETTVQTPLLPTPDIPPPAAEPPPVDAASLPAKPIEDAVAVPVEEPSLPSAPPLPPPDIVKPPPLAKPVEQPNQLAPKEPDPTPQPVVKKELPPVPKPPSLEPPPKARIKPPPALKRQQARPPSEAQKVGIADGLAVETGRTRAAFAAIVSAQIRSHQFYPEAARAKGISGRVVVSFTIGHAGTATSVSIVHSSGNAELDDAARQAVKAIRVPPPPSGTFSASAPFSFGFR